MPIDGKPVIGYQPGQYLGIAVCDPHREFKEIHQYSVSDKANNETYRISVKREIGEIPGIVSNYLHDEIHIGDQVNLYAPAGDFFFTDRQDPLVLLSAGVGITIQCIIYMPGTITNTFNTNDDTTIHIGYCRDDALVDTVRVSVMVVD